MSHLPFYAPLACTSSLLWLGIENCLLQSFGCLLIFLDLKLLQNIPLQETLNAPDFSYKSIDGPPWILTPSACHHYLSMPAPMSCPSLPTHLYLTCLDPTASASHPPYVMLHINANLTQHGRFVWMHMTFADSCARAGSCRLLALHLSLPVIALAQPPKIVLLLNAMVLNALSLFVYYAHVL